MQKTLMKASLFHSVMNTSKKETTLSSFASCCVTFKTSEVQLNLNRS